MGDTPPEFLVKRFRFLYFLQRKVVALVLLTVCKMDQVTLRLVYMDGHVDFYDLAVDLSRRCVPDNTLELLMRHCFRRIHTHSNHVPHVRTCYPLRADPKPTMPLRMAYYSGPERTMRFLTDNDSVRAWLAPAVTERQHLDAFGIRSDMFSVRPVLFVQGSMDTIAMQHRVKLGPRIGSNVVVLTGLNAGDKVITDGFQRLRDKGKVTLGKPKAAGAPGAK